MDGMVLAELTGDTGESRWPGSTADAQEKDKSQAGVCETVAD